MQICDALTVHAKMEAAIFYPALRRAGKTEDKESVLEAAEEHGRVNDLIAKIRWSEGRDETFKAKLTVLKEIVEHHLKEEESTMFDPAARRRRARPRPTANDRAGRSRRVAIGTARTVPRNARQAPDRVRRAFLRVRTS